MTALQMMTRSRLFWCLVVSLCTHLAAKDNIAVFNLEDRGGMLESEIKIISDRISTALFNTRKFNVIERQQIGEILREQGFQQSGACSDEQCLVEVGQLLAVHQMIGGGTVLVCGGVVAALFISRNKGSDGEKPATHDQNGDEILSMPPFPDRGLNP